MFIYSHLFYFTIINDFININKQKINTYFKANCQYLKKNFLFRNELTTFKIAYTFYIDAQAYYLTAVVCRKSEIILKKYCDI